MKFLHDPLSSGLLFLFSPPPPEQRVGRDRYFFFPASASNLFDKLLIFEGTSLFPPPFFSFRKKDFFY